MPVRMACYPIADIKKKNSGLTDLTYISMCLGKISETQQGNERGYLLEISSMWLTGMFELPKAKWTYKVASLEPTCWNLSLMESGKRK